MGQKANLFWDAGSNSTRTIIVQRLLTCFIVTFHLSEHRTLQSDSYILGIWDMLVAIGTVPCEATFWPPGFETLYWGSRSLICWRKTSASRQYSQHLPPTQAFLFWDVSLSETSYTAGTTMIHFPVSNLLSHHNSSRLTQHAVITCTDLFLIIKIAKFSGMPCIHLLLSPQYSVTEKKTISELTQCFWKG